MKGRFRELLHELDEAIFPSSIYCISCGSLINRTRMYSLCDDCIGRFHWITGRTCEKCGKAMPPTSQGRLCYDCMQEEHFFRKGFSCLTYGLYERQLMMDLKYGHRGYLARIFGDVMFDRLEWEIREGLFSPGPRRSGGGARGREVLDPQFAEGVGEEEPADERLDPQYPEGLAAGVRGREMLDMQFAEDSGRADSGHVRIDLIVPVPISKGRMRKRGYNQAAVMAQQLARRWKECVESTPSLYPAPACRTQLLYRTRETVMLRSLNPTERRMALQAAFAVNPQEQERLAGKTVLLIDDIYTTGATADACSQGLLEGGASDVYLLTLASGGNRRSAEIS